MQRFNFYNFTDRYGFRSVLSGVFHDSGYKVASDGIILIALKSDYPEELEHHIIGKDGQDIMTKYPYPRWRTVLPDGKDYKPYRIETAQFEAFLKERRAAWKESVGKGTMWGQYQWNVKVGPAHMRAHKFETFLSGMKEIGATEVFVNDHRRTVYAKTDKGWVLISPILAADDADKDPNTVTLA